MARRRTEIGKLLTELSQRWWEETFISTVCANARKSNLHEKWLNISASAVAYYQRGHQRGHAAGMAASAGSKPP